MIIDLLNTPANNIDETIHIAVGRMGPDDPNASCRTAHVHETPHPFDDVTGSGILSLDTPLRIASEGGSAAQ